MLLNLRKIYEKSLKMTICAKKSSYFWKNDDMSGKIFVFSDKLRYIRKNLYDMSGKNFATSTPTHTPPPPLQHFWEKKY